MVFIWPWTSFPVRCVIFEKRGDSLNKYVDSGRRFEDKNTGDTFYRFKKKKRNTMPVSYKFIYNFKSSKGKIGNIAFFYSPSPAIFYPIDIPKKYQDALLSGNIESLENEIMQEFKDELPKLQEKADKTMSAPLEKGEEWLDWLSFRMYKNRALTDVRGTIEKFLPWIALIVVMIMAAVAMWIIFRGMEGMVDRAAAAEDRWIKFDERFLQVIERMTDMVQRGELPISVVEPLGRPPPGT